MPPFDIREEMGGAWFHPQQNFQSSGWRRRKRAYRVGGGASSRSIAAPVLKLGYDNLNEQRNYSNVESDSTSSSDYQRENSPSSYKQTSGGLTSMQMDENISKSEKIRHSSSSIIEKLMALDDLHTPGLVPKKQMAMRCGGSRKIVKDKTKPINMVFPDLHGIKWLRSPRHERCITNLKSSGVIEYETDDIHHRYERTTERKDKIYSARKRTFCLFSNSLEECSNFSLARLRYAGKNNSYTHPGKVVSLNRNLKKDDKVRSSTLFPKQAQNVWLSSRIQSRSRFQKSLSKGSDQQNFSSNAKDVVAKKRDSREVDRDVKNLVKQSLHVDSKIKFDREEHKLSPNKLVSREELCKKSYGKPSELNPPHSSAAAVADSSILDDMFSVSCCTDVNMILVSNRDLAKEVTADVFSTQNEAQPPSNIKQDVQLSPTYVHEFPSIEEDTSELCLQLQIAKSNSENTCGDFSKALKILDDNNLQSLQQNKDVEFSDEEARNFSYLLDILLESGNYGTKKRRILDASYMLDSGIGTDVFEKLEKKYSKLALWSRSERKLFFDLLNSILVEILAPKRYLFPWVDSTRKVGPMLCFQGIAEKAWQTLSRKCKEFHVANGEQKVMDEKWLDWGDDIDEIGKEIGRMLQEELLEELVSDFIFD